MPYRKKRVRRKRRGKKRYKARVSRPRMTNSMRVALRKTGSQTCTATATPNSQSFKLDDFGSKTKFTDMFEQYRIVYIKQTIYPTMTLAAPPLQVVGTIDDAVVDTDQVQQIQEMLLGVKVDRDDVSPLSSLDDCLKNPKIRIHNLGRGKPVTIKWKPNILVQTTNTGNQSVVYNRWLDCESSSDETYLGLNKLYHIAGASASFPVQFRILTTAVVEFKRFRLDE